MARENPPKYLQIMRDIKRGIQENSVEHGEKLPTEDEFITKYKVSRQTIRHALSQLVNEKVIYRIPGRGTFYANSSKPESPITGNIISVIIPNITDYIFPSIIEGIGEVLRGTGYNILLFSTQRNFELEREALETSLNRHVFGVIIEPVKNTLPNPNYDLYRTLEERTMAVVALHGVSPNLPPMPTVLFDDQSAARELTQFTVDQGHKNIGGIFKLDDSQGTLRLKGFLDVLHGNSLPFTPRWLSFYTTDSQEYVVQSYCQTVFLTEKISGPSAVVCYNDEIAVNLINHLGKQNISVPRDISILGFDDSPLADVGSVGLTTIHHPQRDFGKKAAQIILQILHGTYNSRLTPYVFPPQLVVRTSCAGPSLAQHHSNK